MKITADELIENLKNGVHAQNSSDLEGLVISDMTDNQFVEILELLQENSLSDVIKTLYVHDNQLPPASGKLSPLKLTN